MIYKSIIKPIAFMLDPERAHHLAMKGFSWALKVPGAAMVCNSLFCDKSPRHARELMGLRFPNVVGLAAGFDKNAIYLNALEHLGFGYVEIGTVTPLPQPGNDKPRLFRLPVDEALINRMGFNNQGVDVAAHRVEWYKKNNGKLIIGGNIGKNKITPNDKATDDYVKCFTRLRDVVDYFVVNVSSPNTPGLRSLQEREPLLHLLTTLQDLNAQGTRKPILLKIAPDLSVPQLHEIVDIVNQTNLNGVVATNTTITRDNLKTPAHAIESIGAGGLSGMPVRSMSTDVIRVIKPLLATGMVLMGVGGIFTGKDASEKLEAGADAVQVYTGFIYEGPAMAKHILKSL